MDEGGRVQSYMRGGNFGPCSSPLFLKTKIDDQRTRVYPSQPGKKDEIRERNVVEARLCQDHAKIMPSNTVM